MVYVHNIMLLTHKKGGNFAFCSNMDELGGNYAKWKKSDRERQILFVFNYVWNLKNTKTSGYNKKVDSDTENKLAVASGEREGGWGNIGGGDLEVQTIRYKISYKDILYNTGNIANIL